MRVCYSSRPSRPVQRAMLLSVCGTLSGCGFARLPTGATEQAIALHAMWMIFLWTGGGVAALVYGLIAWCIIRYRRRPSDVDFPTQFRRNDRIEIMYTALPLVLVAGLFALTYPAERHVEAIARSQDVVVDVTGFRWSWRFEYPHLGITINGTETAPPQLVLPIHQTTRLNVTSADVDHSFWVPDFLFKRDAIPGLENVFDWTPNRIGTFRGECGEFCGLDHALMSFTVKVVSAAEFAHWLQTQRRTTSEVGVR